MSNTSHSNSPQDRLQALFTTYFQCFVEFWCLRYQYMVVFFNGYDALLLYRPSFLFLVTLLKAPPTQNTHLLHGDLAIVGQHLPYSSLTRLGHQPFYLLFVISLKICEPWVTVSVIFQKIACPDYHKHTF